MEWNFIIQLIVGVECNANKCNISMNKITWRMEWNEVGKNRFDEKPPQIHKTIASPIYIYI